MKKMTITEIKKVAAEKGIEIKKEKFTINSQTAYRLLDNGGNEKTMTKDDLILNAMQGTL